MTYLQHELSAAFPSMTEQERQDLSDSIEIIGVQNPIVLFEGKVIDGWHRYTVAAALDMPCPHIDLAADTDPRDFVLAQNKARRHLTAGQLIAIASKIFAWHSVGSNQHKVVTEPGSEASISSGELAEKVGLTQRSVEQFREVQRKAAPEVQAAVERGEIGLRKAAHIAKLPQEAQAAAISRPMTARAPAPAAPPSAAALADFVIEKAASALPAAAPTSARAGSAPQADVAELETQIAVLTAQRDEFRGMLEEALADNKDLAKILDADDQLAAAVADAKTQRVLAQGLQGRLDSMMTEIADLKREVKRWQRKAEKAGAA